MRGGGTRCASSSRAPADPLQGVGLGEEGPRRVSSGTRPRTGRGQRAAEGEAEASRARPSDARATGQGDGRCASEGKGDGLVRGVHVRHVRASELVQAGRRATDAPMPSAADWITLSEAAEILGCRQHPLPSRDHRRLGPHGQAVEHQARGSSVRPAGRGEGAGRRPAAGTRRGHPARALRGAERLSRMSAHRAADGGVDRLRSFAERVVAARRRVARRPRRWSPSSRCTTVPAADSGRGPRLHLADGAPAGPAADGVDLRPRHQRRGDARAAGGLDRGSRAAARGFRPDGLAPGLGRCGPDRASSPCSACSGAPAGLYAALDYAFTRVFRGGQKRNEIERTLRGIVVTFLLVGLPLGAPWSWASSASWLVDLAPAEASRRPSGRLATPLGSFLLFVGATVLVYRFVPADRVPWQRSCAPGDPGRASCWPLFTQLFTLLGAAAHADGRDLRDVRRVLRGAGLALDQLQRPADRGQLDAGTGGGPVAPGPGEARGPASGNDAAR